MLFDWLITGQVVASNPASAVRGPKHVVSKGKTPVLSAEATRTLLDSLPTDTELGLRDRALIALLVYTFARIGATVAMNVQDVFTQQGRLWVRLHEKGGKEHTMPAHHNLEAYLNEYLDATGIRGDAKGPLFRTARGRAQTLSRFRLRANNALDMVRRRALAAGIATPVTNHTFRATGITTYMKNGGQLERAQAMAAHSSTRTTQLYNRKDDEVTLDEVERILI
ncbi:MAG: tyrosine-type recombinase/integrase [Gammaproteobacteria bacterium]|nr:tyrosine-type recombinase/integrase [Gammaproteobacteria bacterium]